MGKFLDKIFQINLDSLKNLGIRGVRKNNGIWVDSRKLISFGFHLKQWVSSHGFAVNVTNDLEGFQLIAPCGIKGSEMTSLRRISLENALPLHSLSEISQVWLNSFEKVFHLSFEDLSYENLLKFDNLAL